MTDTTQDQNQIAPGGDDKIAALEAQLASLKGELATVRNAAKPAARNEGEPLAALAKGDPAMGEAIEQIRRFTAANRSEARMAELERMGLEPGKLSRAQLLAIAPDVDPRDAAGAAELARWKRDNSHLFKVEEDPKVVAARSTLTALEARAKNPMFSAAAAMKSLENHKVRR